MPDTFELEDLSDGESSHSSEFEEADRLLGPYREARIQRDHGRSQVSWLQLKHQAKRLSVLLPVTPRKLTQILYPCTLILAGIVISWMMSALIQWQATDPFDTFFAHFWDDHVRTPHSPVNYPVNFFGSVLPIPCHSHNDYWRRTPLFAALGSGCISVEADVWHQEGDLFVGHTENALLGSRTLRSMYINHLVDILDAMNRGSTQWKMNNPKGVFYNDPQQSLTLVVDFKTSGIAVWATLYRQLKPLRERGWLTHWNGTHRVERPITVVVSGAADFDDVLDNSPTRDIFYDAPLEALVHSSDEGANYRYNVSNSHLASVSLSKALGPLFHTGITEERAQTLRLQIRNAKERGLVPRYWGTPRWPRGLRDEIWSSLVHEDVGLLNVDDLRAVRKGGWGTWSQTPLPQRLRRIQQHRTGKTASRGWRSWFKELDSWA